MSHTGLPVLLAVVAAALGSAVNSIAGGGTLLTFPALIWLGVNPLVANATSTVGLWPGSLGSLWGYRGELAGARAWAMRFALPSLLGGATGAWLLLHTGVERFEQIVPFLVFGATALFFVQPLFKRWMLAAPHEAPLPPWRYLAWQYLISVYGGYFGAGAGILMLAVLGLMGLTNIHRMNGLKNWGGLCINVVAVAIFAAGGIVQWPLALAMAAGGIIGGYGGSRMAQRVGEQPVRRAIVAIGLAASLWLLIRRP